MLSNIYYKSSIVNVQRKLLLNNGLKADNLFFAPLQQYSCCAFVQFVKKFVKVGKNFNMSLCSFCVLPVGMSLVRQKVKLCIAKIAAW